MTTKDEYKAKFDNAIKRVSWINLLEMGQENIYARPSMFTSAKRSVTIPAGMYLHVSDKAFGLPSPFSLSFTYGVRLKIAHIPDVALFNCLHSL